MLYGFGHRQVGIMQTHILAYDGDAHCLLGRLEPMQRTLPLFQIGVASQPAVGQAETAADHIVQPFLVEHQRYFVDAAHICCVCDSIHWHIAEIGNLGFQVGRERAVAATDDGIGLNSVAAQDGHGMLRGLGFLLASGCDIGHESDMHEAHIFTARIQAQLTDGFQERQDFYIADRAAYLHDYDIHIVCAELEDALLDLVGDVRDDLDGLAEIVATPLGFQHREIDGAGCGVGVFGEVFVYEAFVVAEIQVGLAAVVCDEHLAVLEGVHRAGIDVDVRVELEHRD